MILFCFVFCLQETTTNTYEGHVFFFTDFKNKAKVFGRFSMDPTKVSCHALCPMFDGRPTNDGYLLLYYMPSP
jgi:hypothetical protein